MAFDLVLRADGTQWGEDQPALLVGLRGICAVMIDVQGARSDLHSGYYGGVAPNPIHALVQRCEEALKQRAQASVVQ